MTIFFWGYLTLWLSCCGAALLFFIRDYRAYSICSAAYWRFLGVPWKLATFAVAASGLTLVAPYTGDPTWDYIDASFMAVLTFVTAPWSAGILYRSLKTRSFSRQTFFALCCWMFSASWSYDLYILCRDSVYPHTWFANIFASSVLYCCAGLLWNLDWRPERGVTFSFLENDWLTVSPQATFRRILIAALPFMLLVTIAILSFVG